MKLDELLNGKLENHIMPFLWVHGEDEATYRNMVRVIHEANIGAFCIEARPHKGFCGPDWWRDLDILLDEAKKHHMRVWILDDKHFPTGYCNGAAENAPLELRRQSLFCRRFPAKGTVRLEMCHAAHPKNTGGVKKAAVRLALNALVGNTKRINHFHDDRFLSVAAIRLDRPMEPVDLSNCVRDGVLDWTAPEGDWEVVVCGLSRNLGAHRSYMNMMDRESCRLLIDAVYEPHYAHYKELFGNVIAGFFSDEPELGNNDLYAMGNTLGTEQDLPWSRELERCLREAWGADFDRFLPMLWSNDCDSALTARVRYTFMDTVTRLVQECFSEQVGDWCREHGVEYIGHVIEDENQHARTGTSLGHYFRGLRGQSMAGIDDIGEQVYPGGEDNHIKNILGIERDAEFYHYALGKLGQSMAQLTPHMRGRAIGEIFGNYGWSEGVRLERYLLDHFMVRGINHFVPHAFTCSAYPEKDCPPHFYAQGNNPQYRHFGALMAYGNRVCSLLDGSRPETPVAILYHGEAEWAGKCMLMQKPARVCLDNQIDYLFVPSDVFAERDFYRTEIGVKLTVNGQRFSVLALPYAQFITPETADAIGKLLEEGFPVLILDALPDGLTNGAALPETVKTAEVVTLDRLWEKLKGYQTVRLSPANNRLRVMLCRGEQPLLYLFNEGQSSYSGVIANPFGEAVCIYDAWTNRLVEGSETEAGLRVEIPAGQSLFLVPHSGRETEKLLTLSGQATTLTGFTESVCRSIDYPNFQKARAIGRPESYHLTDPRFSGFLRYEKEITAGESFTALEISDAHEGVEVFVNGASAGIQVTPPFRYDLTALCHPGTNKLTIEVATTLERERKRFGKAEPLSGITGTVTLYTRNTGGTGI